MPIDTRQLGRDSIGGITARHPVILLPPNVVNLYANATAFSAFTPSGVFTLLGAGQGRSVFSATPAAATVCFVVATGTNFTSGFSVLFEVEGLDENYEPQTIRVNCVGNAAAAQSFPTLALFSYVRAIRFLTPSPESPGTASIAGVTAGPTMSVGTGDGTAAPANFLIQNPHPMMPLGAWGLLIQATSMVAGASYISPNALLLANGKGGFRAARVSVNYGINNSTRLGVIVYSNQDFNAIEQ